MHFEVYVHLPTDTLNLKLRAQEVLRFLEHKWGAIPTPAVASADSIYTVPLYLNSLPPRLLKDRVLLVDLFDPIHLENLHLRWNRWYHIKTKLHYLLAFSEADYIIVANPKQLTLVAGMCSGDPPLVRTVERKTFVVSWGEFYSELFSRRSPPTEFPSFVRLPKWEWFSQKDEEEFAAKLPDFEVLDLSKKRLPLEEYCREVSKRWFALHFPKVHSFEDAAAHRGRLLSLLHLGTPWFGRGEDFLTETLETSGWNVEVSPEELRKRGKELKETFSSQVAPSALQRLRELEEKFFHRFPETPTKSGKPNSHLRRRLRAVDFAVRLTN